MKLHQAQIIFSLLVLCSAVFGGQIFAKNSLGSTLRDQVNVLREKGHKSHTNYQYKDAIKCYTAALQLVEGIPGDDAYELRRRCGLNLAYCNLKDGEYAEAVARCSEVIDESTNFLTENGEVAELSDHAAEMLRQALSTAYRRRGEALQFLGKDELAEVDFSMAKVYKSRTKTSKKPLRSKKYQQRIESLQDFVEECQLFYPRKVLSNKEVKTLSSASVGQQSLSVPDSFAGLKLSDDGGLPSLGGDLGIGSLMSGIGNDFSISQILKQFGPMLGLSDRTVTMLAGIIDTYAKVASFVQKVLSFFRENKEFIVAAATVLWVIYFFSQGSMLSNFQNLIQQVLKSIRNVL